MRPATLQTRPLAANSWKRTTGLEPATFGLGIALWRSGSAWLASFRTDSSRYFRPQNCLVGDTVRDTVSGCAASLLRARFHGKQASASSSAGLPDLVRSECERGLCSAA